MGRRSLDRVGATFVPKPGEWRRLMKGVEFVCMEGYDVMRHPGKLHGAKVRGWEPMHADEVLSLCAIGDIAKLRKGYSVHLSDLEITIRPRTQEGG